MIKSLDYSVTFPTTGRCFQNQIEFAPGLTAITGRNEAGKTIILEMICYALFGKAALRGLASDYKDLSVTLALEVKGKELIVSRNRKKEELTVDGEIVAVGADAINKEVPAILGFDLKVFNIACAAQQGDLGRLTDMRPTERRAMVDQLVGLDLLEGIEKECKAEAKTHETVAMSLSLSQSEPQEPTAPEGYAPVKELEVQLAEVQAHEAERQKLLAVAEPVAPVAPEDPKVGTIEELEAHQSQRNLIEQQRARLEGQLAGMPVPTVSKDDLAKALAYREWEREVTRRGPQPDYTHEQLDRFRAILEAQKKAGEEVSCPKCEHEFHPGLTAEEEKLVGEESPLTLPQIAQQRLRIENWVEPLDHVDIHTLPNIEKEILAHAHADERAAIVDQLAALVTPHDRSGDLRTARAYREAVAVYDERAARFAEAMGRFEDARSRLAGLDDKSALLGDLAARVSHARQFEMALGRYREEALRYSDLVARVSGAKELAAGFASGATSLKNVRAKVKAELAPSLAKAASSLVTSMTDGERRFIDIDEDFNILVDGQPLQTLSGSGKSVVNLALRLGLGQVLTAKVLPIFMGDEIDKDMDQTRASSTHDTLERLREYLSQIIVVTHKEVEADTVIQL